MNKNWFELEDGFFVNLDEIRMICVPERLGGECYIMVYDGYFDFGVSEQDAEKIKEILFQHANVYYRNNDDSIRDN